MKKLQPLMKKRSFMVGFMIFLALYMNACASSYKKSVTINEAPIHERALTKEDKGVQVSAAVVGNEEARQIFGIDLSRKNIQAI